MDDAGLLMLDARPESLRVLPATTLKTGPLMSSSHCKHGLRLVEFGGTLFGTPSIQSLMHGCQQFSRVLMASYIQIFEHSGVNPIFSKHSRANSCETTVRTPQSRTVVVQNLIQAPVSQYNVIKRCMSSSAYLGW